MDVAMLIIPQSLLTKQGCLGPPLQAQSIGTVLLASF